MNLMYVKYNSKNRQSIIKEGDNIIKISDNIKNLDKPKSSSLISLKDFKDYKDEYKNKEITNFFFEAVHKNYLKNR